MLLRERAVTLAGALLAAAFLAVSSLATVLAEEIGDGDGFDGDEVTLPLVLSALIIVGLIAYLARRRRASA